MEITGLTLGDITGKIAKAAARALEKVDPAAKHVDTPVEKPGSRADLIRRAQSGDVQTRRIAEAELAKIEV